jgi:Tfp pilus assembly protein PilO
MITVIKIILLVLLLSILVKVVCYGGRYDSTIEQLDDYDDDEEFDDDEEL